MAKISEANKKAYRDEKTGELKIAYRIRIPTAISMFTIAVILDFTDVIATAAVGIGLATGTIEAILENVVFFGWFALLGVPYTTNVWRFVVSILTFGVEVTPAINNLPAFTVGITLIIIITRYEDKHDKDYSLLTLADPRNVVARASRKSVAKGTSQSLAKTRASGTATQALSHTQGEFDAWEKALGKSTVNPEKVTRKKRFFSSERNPYRDIRKTASGTDAAGNLFEVKYSLDQKETLKQLGKEYLKGKVASSVEKEKYDGDGFADRKEIKNKPIGNEINNVS